MTEAELLSKPLTLASTDPTTPTPIKKGLSEAEFLAIPGLSKALSSGRMGVRGVSASQYLEGLRADQDPLAVKAANQGHWAEAANSVAQLLSNTLQSGINSVITLPGLNTLINKIGNSDQEFGNVLSDYVNKVNKDFNQEVVPVYNNPQTRNAGEWLFENLPSLGSTVGMLLPVLGEIKLLGLGAKAMQGWNLMNKIVKASRGVELGSEAGLQWSQSIDAIVAGLHSRHAESVMEGQDAGNQAYEEAIAKGFSEATAKKAQLAASQETYLKNWPLLALDIMQFGVAFRSFKGLSREANALEAAALKGNRLSKTAIAGGEILPEGYEEYQQYITTQEAVRNAKIKYGIDKDDYSTFSERMKDYMAGPNSDQLWTSTIFGLLGGGVFAGIANTAGAINEKKGAIMREQVKTALGQTFAVVANDPVEFAKKSHDEIHALIFNAVENRRADDVKNLFSLMKESNLEGHTDEEKKELKAKADFGLAELEKYTKLYDEITHKNTPEVTHHILAVNGAFTNWAQVQQERTIDFHNALKFTSELNHLDASYSKVIEAEAQLKVLDEFQKEPNLKIDKSIYDTKRSLLQEEIKQHREAIAANEGLKNETQEEKNTRLLEFANNNRIKSQEIEKNRRVELEEVAHLVDKVIQKQFQDKINAKYDKLHKELPNEPIAPKGIKSIDEKINKIDRSRLTSFAAQKVLVELHLGQLGIEAHKATTADGIEEIKKRNEEHRKKQIDTELDNLIDAVTPEKTSTDIQKLREDATKLGKAKEFETKYNQKLAIIKTNSPKFDPSNTITSLTNRWKDNNLLKEHEINNISKIMLKSGGIPENSTIDENSISALANSNPIFAKNLTDYFKNSNAIKTTIESTTKVATSSSNVDPNEATNKEKKQADQQMSVGNAPVWVSQGTQFEWDKAKYDWIRDANGNLVPRKSNLTDKIDWKYLNSGSIPIEADLSYEYDYNDEWNKKNKNPELSLFEIVHYEVNGNRHVIGALTAYDPKRNYETVEDGNKLKALREQLWKEAHGKPKIGIQKLDTGTRLKMYLSTNTWNVVTLDAQGNKVYNSPLDVLKPDEQLILGVARLQNDIPYLDFNGDPIGNKKSTGFSKDKGSAGMVYMMILNPATKEYYPVKLFTKPLKSNKELHEFVANKMRELENDPTKNKEVKDDISDFIFMHDLNFVNGNYNLTVGDIKDPKTITINPNELEQRIGELILQVDVSKINKDVNGISYNKQLAKNGFISTDLNPNEHFHSTNIQIEPYLPGTTFVQGELKITGEPLPSPATVVVGDSKFEKIQGVGTTAIDLNTKNYVAQEGVFEPIDVEKAKAWANKYMPGAPPFFTDALIEINKNGGEKAWGQVKDGIVSIYKGAPKGTEFHEAGHLIFNHVLNAKQREDILNELSARTGIKRSYDRGQDGTRNSVVDYNEYFAKRYNPVTKYTGYRNKEKWQKDLNVLINDLKQAYVSTVHHLDEGESAPNYQYLGKVGDVVPITLKFLENIKKNAQHSTSLDKPFAFRDATPKENQILGKFYNDVIAELKESFGDRVLPKNISNERLFQKLSAWLEDNYGLQTFNTEKGAHPYGFHHIYTRNLNQEEEVSGGEVFIADTLHFPEIESGHNKNLIGTSKSTNTLGWFIETYINIKDQELTDLFLYEFQSDILPEIESGDYKFAIVQNKEKPAEFRVTIGYMNFNIDTNNSNTSIRKALNEKITAYINELASSKTESERHMRGDSYGSGSGETRYTTLIDYIGAKNKEKFISKLVNEEEIVIEQYVDEEGFDREDKALARIWDDPKALYRLEKKLGAIFGIIIDQIPHLNTSGSTSKNGLGNNILEYNGYYFDKTVVKDTLIGIASAIGKAKRSEHYKSKFTKDSTITDYHKKLKKIESDKAKWSKSQEGKRAFITKYQEENKGYEGSDVHPIEEYYTARQKAIAAFLETQVVDALTPLIDGIVNNIQTEIEIQQYNQEIHEKGIGNVSKEVKPKTIDLEKVQEDYKHWYNIMFEKFIKIAFKRARDNGYKELYLPTYASMKAIESQSKKTGRIYAVPQENREEKERSRIINELDSFDSDNYRYSPGKVNNDIPGTYYKHKLTEEKNPLAGIRVINLGEIISKEEYNAALDKYIKQFKVGPFYAALSKIKGVRIIGLETPNWSNQHLLKVNIEDYNPTSIERFSAISPSDSVYQTNDLKLEEILMNGLADYIQSEGKIDQGWGYNVKQFFTKIWQFIKSMFTDNVNIDGFYQRVNSGFYKNKPLSNYKGTNFSIANTNPYRVNEAIETINYQFFKALDEIKKEYSLGDQSDLQALKKISSNTKDALGLVYQRVFNGLIDAYNKGNTQLEGVLNNFYTVENGKITGTGDYYGLAIQDLVKYGVVVREARVDRPNNSDDLSDTVPEDFVFNFNEDDFKEDIHQKGASFINPKDTLTYEVRKTLRQLEKYKYYPNAIDPETGKKGAFLQTGLENYLGFHTFVNYDEVQNYLQKNIANIFDVDDMMNKLDELKFFKPEIYGLLNKLNENERLKTRFFSNFSKTYIPYIMIQQKSVESGFPDEEGQPEKETRINVFNANTRSINRLLIDEWNTNLITHRNEVTNQDGSIDKVKAALAFNDFNVVVENYRKFKEVTPEVANRLSATINKFGLTISPQVFTNEFNARVVWEDGKRVERTPYNNLLDLLTGKNSITTILSNVVEGTNPYQGDAIESSALRRVTGAVARTESNLHQDSIINSSGDTQYSYLSPTFLHKKVAELKTEKGRELYLSDGWFMGNKWLQDLANPENQELRDVFEVSIFNAIKLENQANAEFSNLTTKELAIADINLYDNPNGKNYAFYRTPIITGSSMAPIIRFLKYDKATVIEAFYQLALVENRRIQNLVNLDIKVKNLTTRGNQYQFVDIFNEKPDAINTENTAKLAIEEWLQDELAEEKSRLETEGVITSVGNLGSSVDAARHNSTFKDYEDKVEEYFYNRSLASAMIIQLFHVDPSYYKNNNDFQHRGGQILKTVKMIDTKASYNGTSVGENYNAIYIVDEKLGDSDITDSQTYISVDRRRKIGIGYGEWDENSEKGYELVKKGKAYDDSFSYAFSPQKPFYFNHETLGADWILPVQIKNMEVTLVNNFTKGKPKLEFLREYMESNGIDSVIFTSAVKAGEYGAVSFDDLKAGTKPTTHIFQNKYYGRQTEMPNHHVNVDILNASQQKKLITGDIPEGTKFFDGKIDKQEIYDAYQKLITINIIDSYNQIEGEFKDINEIQRILLNEVQSRGLGNSFRKALEIKDGIQGDKVFNIPLFDPIFGYKMQAILNAIIRNNVTKQRINGGSLAYMSAFGIVKPSTKEELKVVRDKDGNILHYEVMLPAWMKEHLPRNPKGEVDFEAIKKEAPGLLEMFGYFIPTEGKNSMMAANLVGFIPDLQSGVAAFPKELVAISGKDFDKDDVYIMIPNHEIIDGVLQKVGYGIGKEGIGEKVVDINLMKNVLPDEVLNKMVNVKSIDPETGEESITQMSVKAAINDIKEQHRKIEDYIECLG